MKKALLITAHQNPNQLMRLLQAVSDEFFDCFIHLDKKSDRAPFDAVVSEFRHARLIDERYTVSLEHSSQALAILAAARFARQQGSYSYYISMTAQCYPLFSGVAISDRLDAVYPAEIIDSRPAEPGTWCEGWGRWQKLETPRAAVLAFLGKDKYETWEGKLARAPINLAELILTLFKGRPKENLSRLGYRYSAGSYIWMLTDRAMSFILDRAENDTSLMKIFRSISTPEECFFQTVLTASPYHGNRATFEKHDIHVDQGMNRQERSDILRFICDARDGMSNLRHPLVITMQEKDLIMRSRALFGRKFDESVDSEILDLVDWLRALPEEERLKLSSRPL